MMAVDFQPRLALASLSGQSDAAWAAAWTAARARRHPHGRPAAAPRAGTRAGPSNPDAECHGAVPLRPATFP